MATRKKKTSRGTGPSRSSASRSSAAWREPHMQFRRQPSFDPTLGGAQPTSDEERQLVESLANELAYRFVLAAANPAKQFACDSIEARVQRILAGKSRASRDGYQHRAANLLKRNFADRQMMFGEFARSGARRQQGSVDLASRRDALASAAARKRVEAYARDITAFADYAANSGINCIPVTRTTLKGELSWNLDQYYTQIEINQPQVLHFSWSTEAEDAEIGEWQVCLNNSLNVVASGTVNQSGGNFSIDFSDFLVPVPYPVPLNYFVRIRPRTKAKTVTVPGATPGSTVKHTESSKILGGYSNPVWVTYVMDTSAPQTFNIGWAFRKLDLVLDSIHLVRPQSGEGTDEYYLYGTVHEVGPDGGTLHEIDATYHELGGGDHPRFKELHDSMTFDLDLPTSAAWPKAYVVMMHLIEVDGGGEFAEIIADFWELAEDIMPDIYDAIKGALEELGIDEWGASGAAALAVAIAGAISANVATAVAGAVLAALAYVVAVVIIADEDDYFGSFTHVLPVIASTEDYVLSEFDGETRGPTQVDDPNAPYGSFVTKKERFRVYGQAYFPSASAYDGIVDINLHWRFWQMEYVPILPNDS